MSTRQKWLERKIRAMQIQAAAMCASPGRDRAIEIMTFAMIFVSEYRLLTRFELMTAGGCVDRLLRNGALAEPTEDYKDSVDVGGAWAMGRLRGR